MERPDNLKNYPERDLKLGIKSSLPKPKATIGLFILIWKIMGKPADIVYADEISGKLMLKPLILEKIRALVKQRNINENKILEYIKTNNLLESQLEALIVAFELVWSLGKIEFENGMTVTAERTGGLRYSKKISFTINMDFIDLAFQDCEVLFYDILLNWIGLNELEINTTIELRLIKLLTMISEKAVFKLQDGNKDVVFNNLSIYSKVLRNLNLDIKGDVESKGSLRILLSELREDLNLYLQYDGYQVSNNPREKNDLAGYSKRVDTYLLLSGEKKITFFDFETPKNSFEETTTATTSNSEDTKKLTPATDYEQIVFYGVPGSGKSYKIEEEKTKGTADIQKQRVVFHPDYTNADFIGQIIPKMHETENEDGSKKSTIEYTFKPGPFTTILRRALRDENHQYYLIIEEINRGNAAAIFGDLFQLLDRDETTGWSCSPVNNDDANFYIASEYEFFDEKYTDSHKYDADSVRTVDGKLFNRNTGLRLPPNLTIYATMNTNDQNVFILDNAFNRRFKSEHISNKVNMEDEKQIAQHNMEIENTGVLWGAFRNAINDKIIESELANAEDKQLGLFFIKAEKGKSNITQKDFSNKVLKYLWHDVFKRNKEIFNQDNIKKFEDLIDNFTGKDAFVNCFEKSFVDSFDNTELVKQD